MLAKLTAKNQLTLPKAVVGNFPGIEYFEVSVKGGRIVLAPVELQRANAVREKLEELGVTEQDVRKAVEWARGR